ncbi:hypothetical protein ACFE04_017270 [Oxalis oulophora]
MSSLKHLGRLVDGLSLVGKEIVNRSQTLEAVKTGDIQTLIKKAIVSATDISGLTKGKVRQVSGSSTPNQPKSSSVVYFTESPDHTPTPTPDVAADPIVDPPPPLVVRDCDVADVDKVILDSRADVPVGESEPLDLVNDAAATAGATVTTSASDAGDVTPEIQAAPKKRKLRERRVPSTPFSRAVGFAGLGVGLAWGTVQESAKRLVYGTPDAGDKQSATSPFLSDKNAERLALALCRMRGAALKIGQMLSIQDESVVPAPNRAFHRPVKILILKTSYFSKILAALDIVRQGADVMPRSQLNEVLDAELGSNWQSKLTSFDYEPLAAASIGQVHRAVTKDGVEVAMKIQYPGVADSIESDLKNVELLFRRTNLLPKGLHLERAMKVAKEELSLECDYELEAANQKRFRNLLLGTSGFYVPFVVDEISSKRVLTTELVSGVPVDKVAVLDQETRNYVGKKLLELTLLELFVYRFMQTDPNWGNFLYDEATRTINLIDFGAARGYPKSFVDDYLRMVVACANCDREAVIEMSQRLGFLTGMESEVMLDAHVQAGFVVGLPFSKPGGYDFAAQNITQSLSNLGSTMLKHRLTPPPDEAYSLHRKLSGAFLACIKLHAVVPCREMLFEIYEQHRFGEDGDDMISSDSTSG